MMRKRKNLSQLTLDKHGFKRSKKIDEDEPPSNSQVTNGRAGRILRIYLRNFMCHTALEIKFDPNTNYVVGRNGSGKSAILTALIVGLGGKARLTNRGASMKAFIKVGQTAASIEITLSNTGPMAFEPKVFGKEITVIRSFTETTNSYKLKSSSGQIVSNAFRDVNKLIVALNIQVDNPVCILNQDVARTFLNSNDPAKKYIMFMKATNLENVKYQNKISLRNKKQTVMSLKVKIENLKKLEKEVKRMLEKYRAFENMKDIESTKKNLDNEAVWAQIHVIEQELAQKQNTLDNLNSEVENFSDLIKNKSQTKNNLTQNIEQIKQKLIEIRNEEEINQSAMNSKRTQLQKFRETLVGMKNDITSIENMIKRKVIDQKNIENEINNSSEHHTNRLRMIQERDKQLASLEQKLREISKLIETAEHDLTQTRSALKRKQQEENNLNSELSEVSAKVKQRQAKIRAMKVDENNSISVYGGTIQKILQSINASKEQFIKLPKGPVGSYVKLKDKKWALAIEDFISHGMLMSFCVDNHRDAKVLTKIFTQVCGNSHKPTIINSKFYDKVHNFSKNKVIAPNECTAMIDALLINDPVITNCLIDQLSIENVLLIPRNELARQMMSNASMVPRNCARALTLNGDQFYPDPNYRSYSCRSKNPRYLQVNANEVIKIYEEELRNVSENEQVIQRQSRAVSEDVAKLSKEMQSTQTKMSKLEAAQNRVKRDINDLKLQHVPPEPNIEILTEEMGEISKVIEIKKHDLEKIKEDIQNVKSQMSITESEYNDLKQTSKSLETRMSPLVNEITDAETKLKKINTNAKFHADKVMQFREKVVVAKRDLERKKNILTEKLEAAMALGPRMDTKRSLEEVLSELQETEQQLADAKATMGDQFTITQSYMRMQAKYDKTMEEINKVQECLQQMVETVESRIRHFQKLAEYIGVRVREMFIGVLKIRQFKGTIEIDHEKQTLEMLVIPQHGSSQGTGHTHILSGGERSYSTVAFLHALWQVMEYPFYFLDEFDVFMDKVNRRTVMDILLEHAKEHSNLQFVFLTPQDISNVVGDKNITVHRMADPNRNPVQE